MSDDTKICPVCAETIKAAAIKCRFCNTDLAAFTASREAEVEKTLFIGHPAVIYSAWQWMTVVLTLGIALVFYWLKSLATTYEISVSGSSAASCRKSKTASSCSASITSTCTSRWG